MVRTMVQCKRSAGDARRRGRALSWIRKWPACGGRCGCRIGRFFHPLRPHRLAGFRRRQGLKFHDRRIGIDFHCRGMEEIAGDAGNLDRDCRRLELRQAVADREATFGWCHGDRAGGLAPWSDRSFGFGARRRRFKLELDGWRSRPEITRQGIRRKRRATGQGHSGCGNRDGTTHVRPVTPDHGSIGLSHHLRERDPAPTFRVLCDGRPARTLGRAFSVWLAAAIPGPTIRALPCSRNPAGQGLVKTTSARTWNFL
jgi:hypothetical protein